MAVWSHIDHSSLSLPVEYVEWASIPQGYNHLCLKGSVRSDYSDYMVHCKLNVGNGSIDTGSNYDSTYLYTKYNSTVSSARNLGGTYSSYIYGAGANAATGSFGMIEIWIPHYNSSHWKPMTTSSGSSRGHSTISDNQWIISETGLVWKSTSAIDTIRLSVLDGSPADFIAGCTFDLYGLTSA